MRYSWQIYLKILFSQFYASFYNFEFSTGSTFVNVNLQNCAWYIVIPLPSCMEWFKKLKSLVTAKLKKPKVHNGQVQAPNDQLLLTKR